MDRLIIRKTRCSTWIAGSAKIIVHSEELNKVFRRGIILELMHMVFYQAKRRVCNVLEAWISRFR
jgi:hypothetical protein